MPPVDRYRTISWQQQGLRKRRRTAAQQDNSAQKIADDHRPINPIARHGKSSFQQVLMFSEIRCSCRIEYGMESFDAPIVQPLAFFADAMLGRLARWLRTLGYDTAYDKIISDEALIERVLTEQRWLLTRDSYLVQRKILRGRHTLIVSDHLQDQLRQLRSELHLDLDLSDKTASRCASCNKLLNVIPHEKATPTVPAYVASLHPRFVQCPNCGRIYWPGTHWTQMLTRLQELRDS